MLKIYLKETAFYRVNGVLMLAKWLAAVNAVIIVRVSRKMGVV
jgi:hypothetical protein